MSKLDHRSRSMRTLLVAGVIASLLPVSLAETAEAAGTTAGTIDGSVFHDFNSNGQRDLSGANQTAVDIGVAGVEVRAFDADGDPVGSTTTDATGTYSLVVAGAAGTDVRVEFTAPDGYEPSFVGVDNGSATQFVTLDATDVDFGVVRPADYCQDNPDLCVVLMTPGDPLSGTTVPAYAAVREFPNTASGDRTATASTATPYTTAATLGEVGAVWGVGTQRETGDLFLGALMRRHMGLGPNGIDAIYRYDRSADAIVLFTDAIDAGTVASNAARGIPTDNNLSVDGDVFGLPGTMGWGDIDVSADDESVYAVNLFDRSVYSIPIDDPASAVALPPIPFPACNNGEARPWALDVTADKVYAGVTCTGENGGTIDDVIAYVFAYDVAAGTWGTNLLAGTAGSDGLVMNYAPDNGCGRNDEKTLPSIDCDLDPWLNTWTVATEQADWIGLRNDARNRFRVNRTQPLLADLEVDVDGSLTLSFMDRTTLQVGEDQPRPTDADTSDPAVSKVSAGDILRAGPDGAGGFVIENNGSVDVAAVRGGGTSTGLTAPSGRADDPDQGPADEPDRSGGEFYAWDYGSGSHDETAFGALGLAPGRNEVAMVAMNPINDLFSGGGVQWLSQRDGEERGGTFGSDLDDGGYLIDRKDTDDNSTMGKGNGFGDLEVWCDRAPVQVGNRVWIDADDDGIQDPGETPVDGLIVRLYDSSGALVGTAVTNAAGEYSFSSDLTPAVGTDITGAADAASSEVPAGNGDEFGGGLIPGQTGYSIRFGDAADFEAGGVLAFHVPTRSDEPSPEVTDTDDAVDSDLTARESQDYRIAFDAPDAGENDHTYDAGFVVGYELGSLVFDDRNGDGVADPGDAPIGGVTVELLDDNGDVVATTSTDTTTGEYRFTDLSPGEYRVRIPGAQASLTGLSQGSNPVADANGPSGASVDNDNNGVGDGTDFVSGPVALGGADDEPTGEANGITGVANEPGNVPDVNSNQTVDFAFQRLYSIGSLVWEETDNDGIAEPGETPVPGIEVQLLDSSGTVIETQTTGATGEYLFSALPAGSYRVRIPTQSALAGFATAGTPNADADGPSGASVDNDNNGVPDADGFTSGSVTLGGADPEPTGEAGGIDGADDVDPDLPDAQSNQSVDFGFVRVATYSIGSLVWEETDDDGIAEPGETPLAGITVNLLDAAGDIIETTTTASDGTYRFDGLLAGDYRVSIPAQSATDERSTAGSPNPDADGPNGAGVDNDNNGLANGGDFTSGVVTLGGANPEPTNETDGLDASSDEGTATPDERSNQTIDFGFVPSATLSGIVFEDADDDNSRDSSDRGVPGVEVRLLDVDGNLVDTQTTGSDGTYRFTGLEPGTYTVEVVAPAGRTFVTPNTGNDDVDSDVAPSTGRTTIIVLGPGDNETSVDAGVASVTLPATGSHVTYQLMLLAVALMFAGAALLGSGRRRHLRAR